MAQWNQWRLGSTGTQSLAPHRGLSSRHCCSCILGCNGSSDPIPGLGSPYATGQPKKQRKKETNQKTQFSVKNSAGAPARLVSLTLTLLTVLGICCHFKQHPLPFLQQQAWFLFGSFSHSLSTYFLWDLPSRIWRHKEHGILLATVMGPIRPIRASNSQFWDYFWSLEEKDSFP